ncbi:hypothetical protein SGRIM119S_06323 [Streptomyces griseorubiginosus]
MSKAVRLIFTPAAVPHLSSSSVQAEPLVNCGYGSQTVYVLLSAALVAVPPEPEPQAVALVATATHE